MNATDLKQDLQEAQVVLAMGDRPQSKRLVARFVLSTCAWLSVGFAGQVLWANTIALPKSSVFAPLTSTVVAPVASNPSHTISEDSPWIQAIGLSTEELALRKKEEGKIVFEQMVSAKAAFELFSDLGLSPDQMMQVYLHLRDASDAIVISGSVSNVSDVLSSTRPQSIAWLNAAWEKDASQWSSLPSSGLWQTFNDINPNWNSLSDQKKIEQIFVLWEKTALSTAIKESHLKHTDMDIDQARLYLQSAVDDVGLASFVVPFMVKDDPNVLVSLGNQLRTANAELQRTTGWSGKVLGLNHRVMLDNTHLYDKASLNLNGKGYAQINSSWETFSHEWYHAFDIAASQQYVTAKSALSKITLQEIQSVWLSFQNPELSIVDRDLITHIAQTNEVELNPGSVSVQSKAILKSDQQASRDGAPSTGSPWIKWRHDAANQIKWIDYKGWLSQTDDEKYLSARYEMMAFAFEGYHHQHDQAPDVSVSFSKDFFDILSVSYQVSHPESQAQAPAWKKLFDTAQSWWNADQLVRDRSLQLPSPISKHKIEVQRSVPTVATAPINKM